MWPTGRLSSLFFFLCRQPGQKGYGLDGLSQPHLVRQNAVHRPEEVFLHRSCGTVVAHCHAMQDRHPVDAYQLIVFQDETRAEVRYGLHRDPSLLPDRHVLVHIFGHLVGRQRPRVRVGSVFRHDAEPRHGGRDAGGEVQGGAQDVLGLRHVFRVVVGVVFLLLVLFLFLLVGRLFVRGQGEGPSASSLLFPLLEVGLGGADRRFDGGGLLVVGVVVQFHRIFLETRGCFSAHGFLEPSAGAGAFGRLVAARASHGGFDGQ
mmetsp:Transcript_27374/g.62836  ORF Transcript_27374/g.62836 Transcript_27374/m.62836 type:complete len:261 (-) Transcript_27374:817-1599(-)